MQHTIRHETLYRYTAPLTYTIQQLRLTPRADAHQRVLSWQVAAGGRLHAFADAFGNRCHMLTITGLHDEVRIVAAGTVEVAPLDRGRLTEPAGMSPLVFLAPTPLTAVTAEVEDFAARHVEPGQGSAGFLRLAEVVQGSIAYQSGSTAVTSTAADALRLRTGVCQDHAHVFLAACRARGVPARYVSGYIDPGNTDHAESHAWVDVWVDETGFAGWVSIDVTHARFADTSHCRLAIGRDYDSAAPVRGVRRGGGAETLSVRVDVQPVQPSA
ncbi:transglutaminase family protein [Oxalobacteraceae bacterium OM1]|nr:transglutaminase family protein [Oxalobacteraceae bacterium OM1]